MRRFILCLSLFITLCTQAQQINPVPDYVFSNKMSVGRNAVTDTAAYFSIGPRYGAIRGMMPPMVTDTALVTGIKRNGLLIFSVQKNKFLYWDSVRVQWSDMAGGSGQYITGAGLFGYLPQFTSTTTIDTSALYTLGNRLGVGTNTFAYNQTNTANVELNGTAGGILGFKRNDSARGYLWHTGSDMELANTTAGSISFNTNSATRGSISSAGVWRLHNLAGTGDRVVQASSNGTLSASTSVTGLVDTTTISTRAWRQKGDDSLGAIIATKGSGTVTSVATGYGLSGGTITTTGTLLVDTLNISTRAWRQKGIDSVAGLSRIGGSGTTNYVPKFTGTTTLGDSQIFDNGTNVGVGVTPGTTNLGKSLSLNYFGNGLFSYATDNVYLNSNTYYNGDWKYANSAAASQYVQFGGAHLWYTAPSGTANNNVTLTERLRITSGGDVGIGTTSPYIRLESAVNGANSVVTAIRATNSAFASLSTGQGTQIAFANDIGFNASVHSSAIRSITTNISNGASDLLFLNWDGSALTERLRIFANGRIGINTTTDAGYQLDVNGSARAGSVILQANTPFITGSNISSASSLAVGSSSGFLSLHTGNDIMQFNTNGSERMRITASGNVGIGTTSPDINSTGNRVLTISGGFTRGRLQLQNTDNISTGVIGGSIEFLNGTNTIGLVTGQLETGSTTAGFLRFDAGGNTERMRISSTGEVLIATSTDAGDYKLQVSGNIYNTGSAVLAATSGNVGIGTATPSEKLTVAPASGSAGILAYATTSNAAYIELAGSANTVRARLQASGTDAWAGTITNQDFWFATNNTERMRINAAGELLIGTTTDAGAYSLQVAGPTIIKTAASNTPFHVENTAAALTYATFVNTGGRALIGSASDDIVFATSISANERMRLSASGELLLNTTSDQGDYKLQINGSSYTTGSVVRGVMNVNGTGAQISIDSTTNLTPLYFVSHKLTGSNASSTIYGNAEWNTTGNVNLIDFNITNTASGATSNFMRISDGTNIFRVTKEAEIVTAAPTGGSVRKWKLGEAATVSPTSPNRTIRIEIDGTVYYLHAKTTND